MASTDVARQSFFLAGRLKTCPHCRLEKPLEGFGVRRRSPSGRKSWCRACEAHRQQERYRHRFASGVCIDCGRAFARKSKVLCQPCSERRESRRASRRAAGICRACPSPALPGGSRRRACQATERANHLARRRGVTRDEYSALFSRQHGRCAICRRECAPGRHLAVDHDHRTGRVRGLLCFRCNTSLARYEEYTNEFAAYLAGVTIKLTTL